MKCLSTPKSPQTLHTNGKHCLIFQTFNTMIDDVQYFVKENKIWNLKIWFLSILPIYKEAKILQAQGIGK